jgi:hypothetical protein
VHAGVAVAPDPQQFPGEVDGRALAAVGDLVEGALGEAESAAGVLHVGPGAADVAGALLGDLDGRGDLGDGAGLLDGSRLADDGGRRRGRQTVKGVGHQIAPFSSLVSQDGSSASTTSSE